MIIVNNYCGCCYVFTVIVVSIVMYCYMFDMHCCDYCCVS